MTLAENYLLAGRYHITGLIGQGGMGSVYKALDTRLKVNVAVKELRIAMPDSAPGTQQSGDDGTRFQDSWAPPALRQRAIERFWQEAHLLASLQHANLPSVTDYFEESGNYYLVMRFIEGENLAERLVGKGGQPVDLVLDWIRQVLSALAYCHQNGVIHRDVKPANIILTPEGQAFLVDFGIARFDDPDAQTTYVHLTHGFSPPEQYEGRTDIRSDIYALGATLYALLSGREPDRPTARVLQKAIADLPDLPESIPAHVSKAIRRAMALAPDGRYQSMDDFRRALWPERVTPVNQHYPPQDEVLRDRLPDTGKVMITERTPPIPEPAPLPGKPSVTTMPMWTKNRPVKTWHIVVIIAIIIVMCLCLQVSGVMGG